MTKQIIFLGLVCGLLVGGTGCGLVRCVLGVGAPCNPQYGGAMPGMGCGTACGGSCGTGYEPACEPACGPAAPVPCQPACGIASEPTCDQPCCPPPVPCGPLSWVLGLFGNGYWHGGGCGETYYGDYCSDPPDRCNPCDQCGNYIGGNYVGGTVGGAVGGAVGGYPGGHAQGTVVRDVRVGSAPPPVQPSQPMRQ